MPASACQGRTPLQRSVSPPALNLGRLWVSSPLSIFSVTIYQLTALAPLPSLAGEAVS